MRVALTKKAIVAGTVLLLTACAAAPPWQPPASHPVIAVTSVLNPYSALYVSGQNSTDNAPRPAGIAFDVNRQLRDAMHADLMVAQRYRVVDMDADPGVFAAASSTQHAPSILHPNSFFTLDSDLTDRLVNQAQKMGADYVVAAVDIRYHATDCNGTAGCVISLLDVLVPDSGWGMHYPLHKQCGLDTSVYLDYYVFVIDVDSGDTVASYETINDRYVRDIDIDHQNMAALSDPQKAEIGAALGDMVQKSVDASLIHLNLLSGNTATAGPGMAPCIAVEAAPA